MSGGKKGDLTGWFRAGASDAVRRLATVHRYLSRRCTRITCAQKVTGSMCDGVAVEITDLGQVIPLVRVAADSTADPGAIGWENNVPSGLRIFILPSFFDCTENRNLHSIYHEITHKVIETVDHKYGYDRCRKLAVDKPGTAICNAASYGYFAAGIDKTPPDA